MLRLVCSATGIMQNNSLIIVEKSMDTVNQTHKGFCCLSFMQRRDYTVNVVISIICKTEMYGFAKYTSYNFNSSLHNIPIKQ